MRCIAVALITGIVGEFAARFQVILEEKFLFHFPLKVIPMMEDSTVIKKARYSA
jgi:hypothetical protein